MTALRPVHSCDQHAGDPAPAHGAPAQDQRPATPVQEREDRRWAHPAWVATDGAVRNLIVRAVQANEAFSGWAARIGVTRSTLQRLLESPKGLQVGDLALLPADVLVEVLDAWRAELVRVGAIHRPLHDVLADVARETADVTVSVLRKDEKATIKREANEAITALQALLARVDAQ